ncbi:transmembrane protein 107-like [Centruroides vittatus]|uniref:transmembrane protein 107-like n=1 Tax=Centruroides vittatus TaxID=120091 RepID=UPI00350FC7C5
MQISGLVPARFLTIISHLVMLITILWARDENVKACLPWTYTEEEYNHKDNQLIVGLSLAILFVGIELIGFLSGITMFFPTQSLLSIVTHSSATIALAYFITDIWDCDLYWWIFGFCSALPVFSEILVLIGVLAWKKTI